MLTDYSQLVFGGLIHVLHWVNIWL